MKPAEEKKQEETEYKVDQWVEWVHYTSNGMTRTGGPIQEIKEGKARVRRGKKGKKDYWISLGEIIRPDHDPLKNFVSAVRDAHRERIPQQELKQ